MKLLMRDWFFRLLILTSLIGVRAATAAGPEDNFPPGGQIPVAWTTSLGATAGWVVASDSANGGTFSLKSAPLPDDVTVLARKSAAIEAGGIFTTGSVSFAYQVSSESVFDTFEFYIDGIKRLSASGSVTWTSVTFPVAPGAHVFKWAYSKDESNAALGDAAWIDSVVLPPGTLQQLLNVPRTGTGIGTVVSNVAGITCGANCSAYFNTNSSVTLTAATSPASVFTGWSGSCAGTASTCVVTMSAARAANANFAIADDNFPASGLIPGGWTTAAGAAQSWAVASDSTRAGPFSLKSRPIADNQISAIQFTATTGAGNVDFAYKVSSEASYDGFTLYVDNVPSFRSSGEVDWSSAAVPVTAGTHVFKFEYKKDAGPAVGADAAWIDSLVLPGVLTSTLTVKGTGVGAGTIVSTPAGIDCRATCSAAFPNSTVVTLTAAPAPGSTFTGWGGACSGVAQTCLVAVDNTKTATAMFWVPGVGGILDVDGSAPSTVYDPSTDGMLVLRYLFGTTGLALTTGAVGPTGTRTDPDAVKAYLDGIRPAMDIDGNGSVEALTDGLLILRYMFGVRGNLLIAGVVGANSTRTTAAAIEAQLRNLLP